jgi:primase-polymerase (primpol)-like protein
MERGRPTEQERAQGALLAQQLRSRLFEQGAYSELHALPQWVNWRFEEEVKGGKLKKVPYRPGSAYRASPIKPESWGTLNQALKRVELGYFPGIGFMLSMNDPFCMIDLDERQDREVGRISTPLGMRLFRGLNTITEFSPRYGLHFLVRLDRPVPALKSQIEIYYTERYLTVTGNLVPDSPLTIASRQAEVEGLWQIFKKVARPISAENTQRGSWPTTATGELGDWREMQPNQFPDAVSARDSDEEVLRKATVSKNKVRFLELWEGRWMDNPVYQDDQSRADLALVKNLLYWTNNNQAQTNRLFEQSQLMRAKWRDRTNAGGDGHSYGEVTIYNALRYRQQEQEK